MIKKSYRVSYWLSAILGLTLLSGCTTTTPHNDNQLRLSDVEPDSRQSIVTQAMTAEQNSQFDKAIVLYAKALKLQPSDEDDATTTMTNTSIFYKIGLLEVRQGNVELARKAFGEVLKSEPTHSAAQTQLGVIYLTQKNKQDAMVLLTKAIATDQLRLANQSKSKDAYFALDELSPLEAYMGLAVIHDLKNDHNKAMTLFKLILPITPQDPLLFTNIGYSYYLSGNFVEAEINFKKAIDLDMEFSRAWVDLGLVYVRKGMYTKALQTLKQVMPTEHAYNDIGYFLILEGRYREAEYFLERAIELSPSYFVKANVNLENLKLHMNKDIDLAYSKE
ncbi:MAG: tetratricopeptide repeat protein [Moritella sp.]|uniref:tetratricopeptide repeat protein n=1 Tax=Moritella sp. TaxID=78556 RepID=UPI0029B12FA7|nr:tetratricopeptide repeat protein [Moritella sp.]MDX2320340.1 tetratricopeptide repeat protein [Moritella sp.]